MLLKQTDRAVNTELLCHYCHSDKQELNALPSPSITGYHPECHTPTIEPEADSDSWICRQCVFAVSTKVRLLISCLRHGVKIIQCVKWEKSCQTYQAVLPLYCWVNQKRAYSRQKHINSQSTEFSVRCSKLCLRSHKESIVRKLRDYSEVQRSTSKVNQSHVLHFCKCEKVLIISHSISHCPGFHLLQ